MSADRPVTPVTVWKIGLHLKMIWDHGPRLLKNSFSTLPHRSATSRDGAKRYPSASVIVTVANY